MNVKIGKNTKNLQNTLFPKHLFYSGLNYDSMLHLVTVSDPKQNGVLVV